MIDDDYTSYSCIKLATYVEFYVRSELCFSLALQDAQLHL